MMVPRVTDCRERFLTPKPRRAQPRGRTQMNYDAGAAAPRQPVTPLVAPGAPDTERAGPAYGASYAAPPQPPASPDRDPHAPAPGRSGQGPLAPLSFRPGVITLRPSSAGDLIDGAVRTIRRKPGLFLGVAACVIVLISIPRAAIDATVGMTVFKANGGIERVSPSIALMPALSALLTCALAVPTTQAVLGRQLSWSQTLATLKAKARPIALYVLGSTLVFSVPMFLLWFAIGGSDAQRDDANLLLFAATCIGELVRIPFIAAPSILIAEDVGPVRALTRSVALVRGSIGRTFGILILARLLMFLVYMSLNFPVQLALLLTGPVTGYDLSASLFHKAVDIVFPVVTTCVLAPYEAVLRSLYYLDLRVRREGLDVLLIGGSQQADRP